MMKTIFKSIGIVALFTILIPLASYGQLAESYNFGTICYGSFGGTNINTGDAYLDGLQKMNTASMKRFLEAGLSKSDNNISGDGEDAEDFNLALMMEYEKYSERSPNPEGGKRFKIYHKQVQPEIGEGALRETVGNYDSPREIPER